MESDGLSKTVVVGMSGGVDSSVSALLLKQQGYRVIGLFMKNWEEKDDDGVCQASKEYEDVVRVCEHIGIPYYSVNFTKHYWDSVFQEFLKEFELGRTPNPDILCNREIKFKAMYDKAIELGADYLATGHYCQNHLDRGQHQLIKGKDPGKDQTYFLYTMKSPLLKKIIFPVGGMAKSEVRQFAKENQLATSEKKDSTGICFIGERNFRQFLSQYLGIKSGAFVDLNGKVVGYHEGVAYYTRGQRRGMGIGGAGEAWYVLDKHVQTHEVIVGQGARHPALYCDELIASELSWVNVSPERFPFSCQSKIRYRQPDQSCRILSIDKGKIHVVFSIPQRAATPGQSIVFYDGNICLGGGVIAEIGPSYHERGLPLPPEVST